MPQTASRPLRRPESVPSGFRIQEPDIDPEFRELQAAAADSTEPNLRRFTMLAYTGGKLLLANFEFPVVVDLSGLRVPAKSRPILRDHSQQQIVGHTEAIEINGSTIRLAGVLSAANDHAREVSDSADNGFPWQASIGAVAGRVVFVASGETVEVNGRKFTGPLYVARQAVLREVSFVALGADDQTSARLAATDAEDTPIEVMLMEFEQWLQAMGFDADELSEEQTTGLQSLYAASQSTGEPAGSDESDTEAEAAHTVSAAETTVVTEVDPIADLRQKRATELRRINRIAEVCAGGHPDIEAQAIEDGWDDTRTELAVLRAERPRARAVGSSTPGLTTRTLEAAACLSAGIAEDSLQREYGERTLEAAYSLRHIGLRELVAECARIEGHHVPRVFGDGKETIRAGFSTVSLPGILETVMNRTMLAAYQEATIAAFDLCAVGSVSDFKEVSRYRLLGTGGFEKVAPDGELKHGRLSEQKFSNKADTYGQILMLTRQDIINDDLDAFLDITRQMGRSGAESIDDLFFTLLLSNPGGFFGAGNANYLSGVETAFGPDALTQAKTLFRKQKAGPGSRKKDQKPINVRPEILVVPVELETEAELLMGSAQLMIDASGSATKIPVDNPHRNKYRVVSVPHLSDTYYTGASEKAWYLFANPRVLPAFELVFLNGRRTPVIERVEAPPNMLGMGFRGYLDVGLREQDPRGAAKVKGEA
jgi:hypothetical protein